MQLRDILFLSNKSAMNYFRFNKSLVDELKTSIHIELNGKESVSELYYIFKNNLTQKPICDCGKELIYIKLDKGYSKTCGDTLCLNNITNINRKKTNMDRYGVTTPAKLKSVKEKMKKTLLERHEGGQKKFNEKRINTNRERYGVDWSAQNKNISEKNKKTNLERYGVECVLQNSVISDKVKKTNFDKFGFISNLSSPEEREKIKEIWLNKFGSHPFANEQVREKIRKTNIERYGFDVPTKNKEISDKVSESHRKKFIKKLDNNEQFLFVDWSNNNRYRLLSKNTGKEFIITKTIFARRRRNNESVDLTTHPLNEPIMEQELVDFIRTIYSGNIVRKEKYILNLKEIDIYLPELGIAFEFNGLYWHNELFKENNYHLNKTTQCKEKGISLFHIFEDEWIYKKEIIKSIICNKLQQNENKIYGRKCVIKEVSSKIADHFLNQNHIQGACKSLIRYGLYHNDRLVSLMTFGKNRISLGSKSEEGEYEMLRFCNLINTSVIGGASKLFQYFIKNNLPKKITSYSDNRLFNGNQYKQLGFEYIHSSKPNYWYVINNERKHRFNYRKDKLVKEGFDHNLTEHQIMLSKKIYRIYDCGNSKWVYNP